MAKLSFRYGAMGCGKTTQLLQVAYNYEKNGFKILVLKPEVDKKGGDSVVSRLGIEREVDYLVGPNDSIIDIVSHHLETKRINCLIVDEAQFLEPSQVDELSKFASEADIPVICYGLRTDFKLNGFPGSIRLLEIANDIEELKTICSCGSKAIFNARYVDGEFCLDGEQVAIDGMNNVTYKSMCPKCYYKKIKIK